MTMQNTWLITGAQGFIGRYLVDCIAREDALAVIVGLGRSPELFGCFSHRITSPAGYVLAPLPDELQRHSRRLTYYSVDITDVGRLETVLREVRPGRIVHLASGLRGDLLPALLHIVVEGTAALFEAIARIHGYLPHVVLGSTGAVYGETNSQRLPLRETDFCEPADEYSVTKYAAEGIARIAAKKFGIPLVIARIFNVVGAGQDERHVAGRIALEMAKLKRTGGHDLYLGSLSPTRDFIDAHDAARALFMLALAERGAAASEHSKGIFNIASGIERTIEEVLNTFREVADFDPAAHKPPGGAPGGRGTLADLAVPGESVVRGALIVHQNADRNPGVGRHYASVDRLLATGFQPAYSFRSSIASVWNYYSRLWFNGRDLRAGVVTAS